MRSLEFLAIYISHFFNKFHQMRILSGLLLITKKRIQEFDIFKIQKIENH